MAMEMDSSTDHCKIPAEAEFPLDQMVLQGHSKAFSGIVHGRREVEAESPGKKDMTVDVMNSRGNIMVQGE